MVESWRGACENLMGFVKKLSICDGPIETDEYIW